MVKLLLFTLIAALLLPAPAQAQGVTFEDGCDTRILDAIASTTDQIDYTAACEHYRACDSAREGDVLCQFATFTFMLEQCPLDDPDQRCRDGALLLAAAILAFDYPRGELYEWMPPPQVVSGVPEALAAYWAGDDAAALEAYTFDGLEETIYTYDTHLPLSRAVLHARLNQPEAALAEYAGAFSLNPQFPVGLYARALFLADQGRLTEASFDAAALAASTAEQPETAAFVADLTAQYPLDESIMRDWLLYPVRSTGSGVVGNFTYDETGEAPRPVRLGIFEEVDAVVALGIKNWNNSGGADPNFLHVLSSTEDAGVYRYNYPSIDEFAGSVSLRLQDGVFTGNEGIGYFEGGAAWEFMIAPADAPDPRVRLEDQRLCAGSVLSRVGIGSVVTSIAYSDEFPLHITETPNGEILETITEFSARITITAGPECDAGKTWWYGYSSTGLTGWFAENEGSLYNTLPLEVRAFNAAECGGAAPLSPRLTVGESGVVLPDLGANNVREMPDADSALLGAIPPDAVFAVIGGPACVDGVVWWYVAYEALIGWTPEGADGTYWLAPSE